MAVMGRKKLSKHEKMSPAVFARLRPETYKKFLKITDEKNASEHIRAAIELYCDGKSKKSLDKLAKGA